ncbi:tRNA 2-selenouridine(34) synthase MnmH [Ammoniphilus resinae]|uniref:tRNA 2-selenouridine synthase n=1 Tax=Ammoniphilus resinae TaxID=861532 RepID=A0ABS4GRP4_9BACL|nr:tRNA 2-selenouridine(34) synthase MnmH [Ammoniphilus resinae]MBP1932948.1 tRNA 2-selenouridine synthase [Ammoniphilus resinae]
MKEIEIEKAMDLENKIFIDVRSPSEYKENHIPGAINVPIFSDEERAVVGTTYKVEGQNSAKWQAMNVVSSKIPELMKTIRQEIEAGKQPIIYCWRGGMRSKSVCTFAEFSGLNVTRLSGGIRSYRQWITQHLTEELLPQRFVVLHGMTGVGKTIILHMLKDRGFPILDLEALAGHRGSVFGGIGLGVHNQKTFESLLYHDLKKVQGLPYVCMEAESRRIGKATQPDWLLQAKTKGIHIILETTVEIRAQRIYEEYVDPYGKEPDFRERVGEAIAPILKRMTPATRDDILGALEAGDFYRFISTLLTDYYDPRYQHKLDEYPGPFYFVNVDDLERCVEEIIQILSKSNKYNEELPQSRSH